MRTLFIVASAAVIYGLVRLVKCPPQPSFTFSEKKLREAQILLEARRPEASLKQMQAGHSVLRNKLNAMSQDDPGRVEVHRDFLRLIKRMVDVRQALGTAL